MSLYAFFAVALYHTQELPWWMGVLAYGMLAFEFVRACALLVKSIVNSKD